LLLYNLAALKWRNALEHLLARHPLLLLVDLTVAMALLSIGGAWRSSYFVYTLTTLLLFTIFLKRHGVWAAATAFVIFALLRDPAHGLSPIAVFGQTDWDMRVGAALFYVTAGLILGYFDWLLTRIEELAKEKIAETNRRAAIQERTQLALRLHDGAKQMILALRLRSGSLLQDQQWDETAFRQEMEWLWRGLSYLRTELTQLVEALQGQKQAAGYEVVATVREEIQLVEALTNCRWTLVVSEAEEIGLSARQRDALRSFLSEALMNTWKHAGVAVGTIELKRLRGEVVITIADQGRGFDPATPDIPTLGQQSLHHRARELGGQLEVVSRPGQGCRLTLTFPAGLQSERSADRSSPEMVHR